MMMALLMKSSEAPGEPEPEGVELPLLTRFELVSCIHLQFLVNLPSRPQIPGGRIRPLVDDEEMIRMTGKRMLEANGYQVILADSGLSGVHTLRSNMPNIDLVILDLSMPVMDGAECFIRLREVDPDVRVLICTGHGKSLDAEEMIANGALGVVRKPFDLDRLSEAIAGAMGDSQTTDVSD